MNEGYKNIYSATEQLAVKFFNKLYVYTYGEDWCSLKEGVKKLEDFDVQEYLKFLAFTTVKKNGPEFPEVQKIFKSKYEDGMKILELEKYIVHLKACTTFRNINHHESERNLGMKALSSTFFRFVGSYLEAFAPFREIDELLFDCENHITYYDKLKEMAEDYFTYHISADEILGRLDVKYQKVYSEENILQFAIDRNYAITEKLVKTKEKERLISDIGEECRKNYLKARVAGFFRKYKKPLLATAGCLLALVLSYVIYSCATYDPYLYVADPNVISSSSTKNELQPYVMKAKYNPQSGEIMLRIAVKNNTDEEKILSAKYTLMIQVNNGEKYETYCHEFATAERYVYPENSTIYMDIIVDSREIVNQENGKSIILNSENFNKAYFGFVYDNKQ